MSNAILQIMQLHRISACLWFHVCSLAEPCIGCEFPFAGARGLFHAAGPGRFNGHSAAVQYAVEQQPA